MTKLRSKTAALWLRKRWPLMFKRTHDQQRREYEARTWNRAVQVIKEAEKKAQEVLSRFSTVEVARRDYVHEIHVRYMVSDSILYNMKEAEHLWPYIAEQLGHELTRQLQSMRFGAIMEGRECISKPSRSF